MSTAHLLPLLRLDDIDAPTSASIELTSKCNLKCGMCSLTQGRSSTSHANILMGREVWRDLLDGLNSRVEWVSLTGFGEPMLHPDLMDFLADLHDRRIMHGLATNGVKVQEGFLSRLSELAYLGQLNVSIDSFDRETYFRVRRGKVDKCLKTIGRMVEAKGPHTLLSVSCILMKSTLPSLPAAPRKAADLGVRHLVIQSLFDQSSDGIDEHISDLHDAARTIERIEEEAVEAGVEVHFEMDERLRLELRDPDAARESYFDDCRLHGRSRDCGIAWSSTHVDASGHVFPCCRASAVDTGRMGDLTTDTTARIWRGESYRAFRDSLAGPDTVLDVCADCSAVSAGTSIFAQYRARVHPTLSRSDDGRAIVRATNTGTRPWTPKHSTSIAVNRPRDRYSELHDTSWISHNRVCAMQEDLVEAGRDAHFLLPEGLSRSQLKMEHFQLVIDGIGWLPDTNFSLRPNFGPRTPV